MAGHNGTRRDKRDTTPDAGVTRRSLWGLCSVPFIMVLGNSMLIPVLPQIRAALDIDLFHAGLLITAFSLPAGIVIPFTGFLSDRVGRKTIMIPALAVYGLGGLLAGLAAMLISSSYWWILGARVLQGVGAGGTFQLAMALAGDLYPSSRRSQALGLLESWNGMGKVVSPVAGSAAALIAWYAPFFAYGALSIPIALGVWWIVFENKEKGQQAASLSKYFSVLGNLLGKKTAVYLTSLLAGFLVLFMLFGVLSYASDVLEGQYRIRGIVRGLIIAVPVLAMAITAYVSGTVMQKQLMSFLKPAVVFGLALVGVGLASLALIDWPYGQLSALVVLGIGTGMVLPALNTLITSAAPVAERGIVTAFYGTVRFVGVALGPPAFGLVGDLAGRLGLTIGSAVVVGLAAGLAQWLIQAEKMVPNRILRSS